MASVAAAEAATAPPTMLEIENSRYLPSVVALDADGTPLTGRAALQRAVNRPDLTERAPKRALVRQTAVLLGGRAVPTEELAAAVLRRVRGAALAAHGGTAPVRTVLTHPVRWGAAELGRLTRAAALAGIDAPELLPEPVAAALHHTRTTEVPEGACLAVYDLGGGTFDTAVLRRTAGGFDTVAVGGDPHLGGEDLDDCLAALLRERALARDPDPWKELTESGDPALNAQLALLRREIVAAKEALSTAGSVEVAVPGYPEPFLLRAHEYREAATPLLTHSHEVLSATVSEAGLDPAALHAVVLTGGASRTPLISDLIAEREGRLPVLSADPKATVALGALAADGLTPAGSSAPAGHRAGPGPLALRGPRYLRPDGDPDFEFDPYDD
ncbi:Hsp70 family protein [Streptomyces phaeofaciens]|uniref:Hsp70 family protein n=1 Tax=Streptomyces phaeofaciens TaxID=68254 RepID=UPI003696937E